MNKNGKTLKEMFKEKINYDKIYNNVMEKVTPSVEKKPMFKYVAVPAMTIAVVCSGIAITAFYKLKKGEN